jgi:hypothetical protein
MPRTRKGGDDVADVEAIFAEHEAAAKSIRGCFRKKTGMWTASVPLSRDSHDLVRDFRFCAGKEHAKYGPGDSQPQCRATAAFEEDIRTYAKRNPAGTCPEIALKKAVGLTGGKRRTKKRHYKHPKKGRKSRTHKGRKDFTTKKTSKVFNRRSHYQRKSAKGVKRRPYHKRR